MNQPFNKDVSAMDLLNADFFELDGTPLRTTGAHAVEIYRGDGVWESFHTVARLTLCGEPVTQKRFQDLKESIDSE